MRKKSPKLTIVVFDSVDSHTEIDRFFKWLAENTSKEDNNKIEHEDIEYRPELKGFKRTMLWNSTNDWAYGCSTFNHDKEFLAFKDPHMATKFLLEMT